MPFFCKVCGHTEQEMSVKCKGCGKIATMMSQAQSATLPPTMSPPQPIIGGIKLPSPPMMIRSPSNSLSLPSSLPKRVPLPNPVIPTTSLPSSPKLASTPSLTLALGDSMVNDIQKKFANEGLWMRSVQIKNCQCVTATNIAFSTVTRDVSDMFSDSWSFSHARIAQKFFQLDTGTEGKRAMGLIVDWTKTKERYVLYSYKDLSSNKRFGPKTFAKTSQETEADMASMLKELAGQEVEHNEVRTCQIKKEALVGLLWSPIMLPTFLSDGSTKWEETKPKFIEFVKTLQSVGAASAGIPIFTYELSGPGMKLNYIDFLP